MQASEFWAAIPLPQWHYANNEITVDVAYPRRLVVIVATNDLQAGYAIGSLLLY